MHDNLDEFFDSLLQVTPSHPVAPQEPTPPLQNLSDSDIDQIFQENSCNILPEPQEYEEYEDEEEDEDEETEEQELIPYNEAGELTSEAFNPEEVQDLTYNLTTSESPTLEPSSSESLSIPESFLSSNFPATVPSASAEGNPPSEPSSLLPLNSPTLLLDEATSRFSGAEWFGEIQKQRIIIAGIGGIGSNLAFQIARMHPEKICLYDDDRVELANMSGQLYANDDVGKYKVDAIQEMLYKYTHALNIQSISEKFTTNTTPSDIMMCGFDNMQARKTFFGAWCNHLIDMTNEARKKCLFLDGRLSMDTLQVFCLTGDDDKNILRYQEHYLFNDSEADLTMCSMKQTTYLACMIGSVMTNLFTNFVANLLDPIISYDLPFFVEYDAQNMIFKTIK